MKSMDLLGLYHNDGLCVFRSLCKTVKEVIPEQGSARKRITNPAREPNIGRFKAQVERRKGAEREDKIMDTAKLNF